MYSWIWICKSVLHWMASQGTDATDVFHWSSWSTISSTTKALTEPPKQQINEGFLLLTKPRKPHWGYHSVAGQGKRLPGRRWQSQAWQSRTVSDSWRDSWAMDNPCVFLPSRDILWFCETLNTGRALKPPATSREEFKAGRSVNPAPSWARGRKRQESDGKATGKRQERDKKAAGERQESVVIGRRRQKAAGGNRKQQKSGREWQESGKKRQEAAGSPEEPSGAPGRVLPWAGPGRVLGGCVRPGAGSAAGETREVWSGEPGGMAGIPGELSLMDRGVKRWVRPGREGRGEAAAELSGDGEPFSPQPAGRVPELGAAHAERPL